MARHGLRLHAAHAGPEAHLRHELLDLGRDSELGPPAGGLEHRGSARPIGLPGQRALGLCGPHLHLAYRLREAVALELGPALRGGLDEGSRDLDDRHRGPFRPPLPRFLPGGRRLAEIPCGPVQFDIDISPAGEWGDPRSLAGLAALAERSGWDGVFVEDYVFHPSGLDTYDPWVALAAIALATERIRIGTMVTPLPARAPWQVASQAVTVDHLSGGRLILGVGSGDPDSLDVRGLGAPAALRTRAEMLDEGLEL